MLKKRSAADGFNIVHKNDFWAVAQKSYDGSELIKLEKHLSSEECFILKKGNSYVIYEEKGEILIEKMNAEDIYIIPAGIWHTNYLTEGAEVIIVENNNVSVENSEYKDLTDAEIKKIKSQLK